MMEYLNNGSISIAVSTTGAELQSIQRNRTEYIWQRDKRFWTGSAPVLFPICGRLKNDSYTLNGKSYTMPMHGFVKKKEFWVEEKSETRMVLRTDSTTETKECYPFDFIFRVIFNLNGNRVEVTYSVENRTDETMYFSFGAHEAYYCAGGIEQYELVFNNDTELERYIIENSMYVGKKETIVLPDGVFRPTYEEIKRCTYVFRDLKSTSVVLRERASGKQKVRVGFKDLGCLAIWSVQDAEYLCIEPWNGISDYADTTGDLTKKDRIVSLHPHGIYARTHTIDVGETD